jgi:cell wall assembly regulator SMI1
MASRIADVEQQLGVTLPDRLRRMYERHDGHFDERGQWWVLWPLGRLAEENLDAWQRGLPATLLAFGDDGTGNPFCLTLGDGAPEVVRWSWIDEAPERSAGSLEQWVEDRS